MESCKKTFIHLLLVVFCLLMTGSSFARNDNPVVMDQSEADRFNIDILKDMIPPGSYRITDWYEGLSDVFVINIQDYHCNYPTQKQAVVLLNKLFQKNSKLKINFIGLEGTNGWIDTGFAAAVPDENVKNIVADNFFKNGIISGAEYFSIVSSEPVLLYGVDAPESYIKNAELYFRLQDDLVPQREEAKKLISMIHGICMDAGKGIFDRKELDFFEKFVQFHNHDISSVDFAQYLHVLVQSYDIDTLQYEQFMSLIETLRLQSKIDLKSLEYEKFDLLNRMKTILSQEDYSRLVKANMRFSIGTLSAQTLYRLFHRYAGEYKIMFKENGEFKKMNSVLRRLSLLKEPVLKEELQQLVDVILAVSKTAEEKKNLFRLSYILIVMNRMFDLTASRSEYDFYQKNPNSFSVTKIIDTIRGDSENTDVFMLNNLDWSRFNQILGFAGNFYAQAVKRDEQMVNNALVMNDRMGGKNLVIMSGGFHTEGLARIFKERDISYAVLSPEVVSKDYKSSYESIMLNISPPFDAVLAGLASKLMPSSTFNSLLYPENSQILMAKWIIFSNTLMSIDISDLGDRDKMQEEFERKQKLWIAVLEMNLKTAYKKLIQRGILLEDFIKIALNEFNKQLNSIEFDFENYRFHETSASIPVILHGRETERIVISIDQEPSLVVDDTLFQGVLEQKFFAKNTLRIISPQDLRDNKLFNELMNKKTEVVSDETRRNLFILADLFGLETVETLLSNIKKYENSILFDTLSRDDIKKIIRLIGSESARELLLWDVEGFLNLVYAASKVEKSKDFYLDDCLIENYVSSLLSQKFLRFNKHGKMPGFVIKEASPSDIDLWYSYRVYRKFQPTHWRDAVVTNELFYKAISPEGRILGMIMARPVDEMNVIYIDFLETCSSIRGQGQGIGKALLRQVVMDSFVSGFNGAVALYPEEGSHSFYRKLGFVPEGNKYWELLPDKAMELNLVKPKEAEEVHSKEKLDIVGRHKTVSDEEAMTRLVGLLYKFNELTPDDQLFIIAMISKYYIVSIDEAREAFVTRFLTNARDFEYKIQSLYDTAVDTYIEKTQTDVDDYDAVRPVPKSAPDTIPQLKPNSSETLRNYVGLLKEISELRENYVESSFSKTLADRPSSIDFVKSILNRVGLFIDIQLLPGDDVRIKGKTATLLNNIVYFNSSATVADMWFFLPHEVSHLLGDERHARMHDIDIIRNLKSIALTLVEIAEQTTSAQQAELLKNMASGLSYNALLYELDIFTAKLQLTPQGTEFLEKYNLPRFEGTSHSYIESVATFSKDRVTPSIDDNFKTETEWLLKNAGSDINQISQRLNRKIFRNLINFSIQKVTTSTDEINTKLSSWIENQVGRDLWSIKSEKLPDSIHKFITRSQRDTGVIDITAVQRRICTALRNMKDVKAKAKLEKDITDWLTILIRENVEPEPYISELPDVLQRRKANCAGFARLFHFMATQFGLADRIVSVELNYEGKPQLHVVNMIKLSDGTNYTKSITEISNFSDIQRILLRVKNEDEWEYQLITEDELSRMDPDQINGFDQNALDAISYNVSAGVAMKNGDVRLAFSRISKAYEIMPDNPYVTFNMGKIAYLHWLKAMEMMNLSLRDQDKLDKIREIIQTYKLHLIEPRITAFLFDEILMVENAVDPIGGGGQINFPANKVTKPSGDVTVPVKKPDSNITPPKPEEKAIAATPLPSLSNQLAKMTLLPKPSTENQALSQAQRTAGLDAYRTQNLVAGGLSFQSAKQLINVSSIIEADIRSQQFRQAEARLMGLHPDFAHRVMVQNPWVMVFMLELMPEWWKGPGLLELAKKVRISEEIQEMIRKQLETVTPATEISDKDPFRKESEANLLWSLMHKERVLDSLEQKLQKGDVTAAQYREFYNLLMVGEVALLNQLSSNQKHLLFGKRDEILIEGGIRTENGFILGGTFAESSVRPEGESYSSFVTNLVEEHPQELSFVMNKTVKEAPLFTEELSDKIGVPITKKLNEARGGLAIVAEDLFEKSDKDEIAKVIADNILSTEILEAVFTSNMERDGVTDSINRVLKEVRFEIGEQVVLGFFKKYYVEGDELTDQFKKSLRLVQRLIKESSQFREDITNIAVKLHNVDSGKFLYAFMRLAPRSEPSDGFQLPFAKMDHLVTGKHLVEQSL